MAESVYDRINDYGSVRIQLASPNDIRSWSFGEVKKPETINYRTYRAEKDGLFCERIFGPERDWECSCGKYKGTKYKGIICDRCGVKVTHSRVRRKRMGHINLAAPIVHIWFFKALPSRLGSLLDMKTSDIEKIVYFQDYVVTDPGKTPLKKKQLLTEDEYRAAYEKYGDEFEAEMGAEAIKKLLGMLDLNIEAEKIRRDIEKTNSKQKIKDLTKRLKIVEAIRNSREQIRMDGHGRDPGDPAGPAAAGSAGKRQLRHERPERSVSPDHQPQQPAEKAGGPERAGSHHPQRKAHASAGGGRAVRQRPLPPSGAGQQQPPAQVPDRHDQGQAGPIPRKPAGQARGLLRPVGHRRRARNSSCTNAACPRRSRWNSISRSSSASSRSMAWPTRSSRPRRCSSGAIRKCGTFWKK